MTTGDVGWLLAPTGLAHRLAAGTRAVCGGDLRTAQPAPLLACDVYGISRCTDCWPSPGLPVYAQRRGGARRR